MSCKSLTALFLILGWFACTGEKTNESVQKRGDGRYVLKNGDVTFVTDPSLGGRIVSAKLGAYEVLLQERRGLLNWGSTLWPSPQSRWNWPPPAAIHVGNYSAEARANQLVTESATDTVFGFRVAKTFTIPSEKNALEIAYRIYNDSDSAQWVGPWEVTCVPAEGLVFYPSGTIPFRVKNELKTEKFSEVEFFDFDIQKMLTWQKSFVNPNEGWLAYVNANNILFIKSFRVIAPEEIAPEQGNVEVYVNKESQYAELENHGKYKLLRPGDSLSYKVKWHFVQLTDAEAHQPEKLIVAVREAVK